MKINVNIPMNSKRTRILASFMAFLIFALTFQQAFVGWDAGIRVKAAAANGEIHSTNTDKSSILKTEIQTRADTAAGGTSPYTYSGKYTNNNKVALFDYVSDYEITNNTYNTCQQDESGYVDAYTTFNGTISGNLKYPSNKNITFVFKKFKSADDKLDNVKDVHVFMFIYIIIQAMGLLVDGQGKKWIIGQLIKIIFIRKKI